MSEHDRNNCSICLNSVSSSRRQDKHRNKDVTVTLPCGHAHHLTCIATWFQIGHPGNYCPVCKVIPEKNYIYDILGQLENPASEDNTERSRVYSDLGLNREQLEADGVEDLLIRLRAERRRRRMSQFERARTQIQQGIRRILPAFRNWMGRRIEQNGRLGAFWM